MVLVGNRQSGKSYCAIKKVLENYKLGETIGVISFKFSDSKRIKEELIHSAMCMYNIDISGFVKFIRFEDIDEVDRCLIDNLDIILGRKVVAVVNSYTEVYRTDSEYIKHMQEAGPQFESNTRFENVIEKPMSLSEAEGGVTVVLPSTRMTVESIIKLAKKLENM